MTCCSVKIKLFKCLLQQPFYGSKNLNRRNEQSGCAVGYKIVKIITFVFYKNINFHTYASHVSNLLNESCVAV